VGAAYGAGRARVTLRAEDGLVTVVVEVRTGLMALGIKVR